jgi:tRNA(Ile)-lysidine synthase
VERAGVPPRRGNLQAWARDLRYAVATCLALERGARVAAAHTASDQVETVLYRLAASPGRRALLGMKPRDGILIRPLLGCWAADVRAHCLERGLAWREDASNRNADFARSRVRGGLVPALRALHPGAERNVLRTAELLRDEAEVLSEVVRVALAGRDAIALERLGELPPALARLVVTRLAEDAAGELVPGVGGRVPALLALAPRGGSAELDVGLGVRAVVEYGLLRFRRGAPALAPPQTFLPLPGHAEFGRWEIGAELIDAAAAGDAESASLVGLLDAAFLAGPLTVRAWRAGDRMAPLGLGASKSVADILGARHVPRSERRSLPLVESDGEIAWIPGVATGETFRVGSATERVVRLRARRRDS